MGQKKMGSEGMNSVTPAQIGVLGTHQLEKVVEALSLPQILSGSQAMFSQTGVTSHMWHSLKWTQWPGVVSGYPTRQHNYQTWSLLQN